MGKIILFYKYVALDDLQEILKRQRELCIRLSLKGRIILATEGVNGTLGGSTDSIEEYKQVMNDHHYFSGIDFKESIGDADRFPRLRIVIKDEIVRLGISPSKLSAEECGKHLEPYEAHELLTSKPDNLVILDARNEYESAIGCFEESIKPAINTFREFPSYIEKNKALFENKDVFMYCTGGVRCERASAYLKSLGIANNVYQLKGGIHRYLEQYADGFFKGKNYVFDARVALDSDGTIISNCKNCNKLCDNYTNCVNTKCNKQVILCASCSISSGNSCSDECKLLIDSGQVKTRVLPKKRVFA
ncbi:MAG TPA: rhodanese-related sulfurtransferase [Candidatus Babeliaceae bacterium]|nr:rhodanese-related sulfurtransferase [Candidatus Babeliaceae bacterium]